MALYAPLAPDQFRWVIPLSDFSRFRRPKALYYPPDLGVPIQIPAPLVDWPAGATWQREFREVSPDALFDRYSAEHLNYFFIAGTTLTIRSAWGMDYLDFTYYQYPSIPSATSDPITSWICDQYPDAVIEEAAGTVFKMIGKDDEYQRYAQLFAENISILRATDVGEGV
jgi:hypothetical protein